MTRTIPPDHDAADDAADGAAPLAAAPAPAAHANANALTTDQQVSALLPPATALPALGLLGKRRILGLALASLISGALVLVLLLRLVAASQAAGPLSASPLDGHPAPDFTLHTWTWDGSPSQSVRLAALMGRPGHPGHPMVINFWASWCLECRLEEPTLEAAYEKYRVQGVVFLGVAFHDTQQDGTAFLRKYHVTFPSGPTETEQTAVDYGLTGVPETVFIDRQGIVVQKVIGLIDDGTLDRSIQALLR